MHYQNNYQQKTPTTATSHLLAKPPPPENLLFRLPKIYQHAHESPATTAHQRYNHSNNYLQQISPKKHLSDKLVSVAPTVSCVATSSSEQDSVHHSIYSKPTLQVITPSTKNLSPHHTQLTKPANLKTNYKRYQDETQQGGVERLSLKESKILANMRKKMEAKNLLIQQKHKWHRKRTDYKISSALSAASSQNGADSSKNHQNEHKLNIMQSIVQEPEKGFKKKDTTPLRLIPQTQGAIVPILVEDNDQPQNYTSSVRESEAARHSSRKLSHLSAKHINNAGKIITQFASRDQTILTKASRQVQESRRQNNAELRLLGVKEDNSEIESSNQEPSYQKITERRRRTERASSNNKLLDLRSQVNNPREEIYKSSLKNDQNRLVSVSSSKKQDDRIKSSVLENNYSRNQSSRRSINIINHGNRMRRMKSLVAPNCQLGSESKDRLGFAHLFDDHTVRREEISILQTSSVRKHSPDSIHNYAQRNEASMEKYIETRKSLIQIQIQNKLNELNHRH